MLRSYTWYVMKWLRGKEFSELLTWFYILWNYFIFLSIKWHNLNYNFLMLHFYSYVIVNSLKSYSRCYLDLDLILT